MGSRTERALATIGPNGPTFEDCTVSFYDQPLMWMPTASGDGVRIPTGYNATTMEVLHLPDLVLDQPLGIDETCGNLGIQPY